MNRLSNQSETSVLVASGDAAVLKLPASVESRPAPAVAWQADDGAPLYGHKFALGPDNQFVILSAEESDQKTYRYPSFPT